MTWARHLNIRVLGSFVSTASFFFFFIDYRLEAQRAFHTAFLFHRSFELESNADSEGKFPLFLFFHLSFLTIYCPEETTSVRITLAREATRAGLGAFLGAESLFMCLLVEI